MWPVPTAIHSSTQQKTRLSAVCWAKRVSQKETSGATTETSRQVPPKASASPICGGIVGASLKISPFS